MSQIYSKSSFDRFGDDLCEEVLSYLSFEDSFRWECLSKQFKRTVYSKQTKLSINDNLMNNSGYVLPKLRLNSDKSSVDLSAFESILKKCRNITSIEMRLRIEVSNFDQMFDLIMKYCLNLTEFSLLWRFSYKRIERKLNELFGKFAKQLKKIRFNSCDYSKLLLNEFKLCANLSEICLTNCSLNWFESKNIVLTNNLRKIAFDYSSKDVNQFKLFMKSNQNRLKSIQITVDTEVDENCFDVLTTGLSQMTQLIELTFVFDFPKYTNSYINEQLRQIGTNCPNLKRLSFKSLVWNGFDLIETISKYFKQLKRFKLILISDFVSNHIISQSFSELKQLTHLTLCLYDRTKCGITDEFFVDIDRHLPKLQCLFIAYALITDSVINSLAKLPKLETIQFEHSVLNTTSACAHCVLMTNCRKLRNVCYINQT